MRDKDTICINRKGETWKLNKKDILCIKQEAGHTIIVTSDREFSKRGKMDEILNSMHDESFFRCHKYCMINFDKVNGMKDSTVIFEGGRTLGMGINCFRNTRKAFLEYLNK